MTDEGLVGVGAVAVATECSSVEVFSTVGSMVLEQMSRMWKRKGVGTGKRAVCVESKGSSKNRKLKSIEEIEEIEEVTVYGSTAAFDGWHVK